MAGHREIDSKNTDEPTLIRQAQEGVKKAFTVLRDRYSARVDCCIRRHATSDADVKAITQAVWKDIQRQLSGYDPSQTHFADFVEIRTKLTILRYYAFPARRNATVVDTLCSELQEAPSHLKPEKELAELFLVMRAQDGGEEAFKQLWDYHAKVVFGFLRARVRDDETADHTVQHLLNTLWLFLRDREGKGLNLYDPSRGPFITFARYYADRIRKKYYTDGGKEVLFSGFEGPDTTEEEAPSWETTVPDPSPSVEDKRITIENEKPLWQAVGNSTSPPHQVIICGFNKLLAWKPEEVVDRLSDNRLGVLEAGMERNLAEEKECGEQIVADCFRKLRHNMDVTFGVVVRHARTRATHQALLECVTGDIVLRELYSEEGTPEDDVAKWSHNVWRGIRIGLLEEILGSLP